MSDSPDRDPDVDARAQSAQEVEDAVRAAILKSPVASVRPGEAPSGPALLGAMGGVRGLVESILPGVGFLVIFTLTGQVLPSVLIPLGLAAVFIVARVLTRAPYTSAVVGLIGVALSAGLALVTGRAQDNFLFGFGLNALFLIALIVSLAARRPLVGVIASLILGDGRQYRRDRAKRKVVTIATLLWAGLFAVRLGVEVPLYLAGNTAALAALKLLLGVPLYAAMLWVTWLLIKTVYARAQRE